MTEEMEQWKSKLLTCSACPLCKEGNRGPTAFTGSSSSPILFVGEGPGGVEDEYGVPLIGPSGQLLDKALWSVGITRDNVYVTNIVKCRPHGNRTPTLAEGQFCADKHLLQEIQLVKPVVIVALGKVAFQYFYGSAGSIMKNRGRWLLWKNIPVMPTYHPAFLLRQTGHDLVESKWQVYYDLKAAKERALELVPGYEFKSEAMTNLLGLYTNQRQERHFL